MENKTRYNSKYNTSKESKYNKSYTEKYLKKEIDFLLAPSFGQLNNVDFEEVYIPCPQAEEFLSSALKLSSADKILYLTGLTGSGKSMVLRSVFKFSGMTPKIHENTLIIPFSFDNFASTLFIQKNKNALKSIEELYVNMLTSARKEIEKNCTNIKKIENNKEEFLKHVEKSRGDYVQDSTVFDEQSTDEKIQNFLSKAPIPFCTAALKFYLNQSECSINNVVLIVDDVEGTGENCELIPINIAYRIITCFENQEESKNWSVNLVIGCRNYVFRLINNIHSQERQQVETYTESEEYHIETTPSISNIVLKRYTAISKKDMNEKWKIALDVVLLLITDIDSSVGDFILNLNIRNMRKALSLTKKIVYNRQWIQRNYTESVAGAFSINSVKEYDVTPATLIRAIGMEESVVYDSDISYIPNVLYNRDDMDLYLLLVLRYCMLHTNNKYADWGDTIHIDEFYKGLKNIYGLYSKHIQCFKKATEYLILHRLLLRSIDQLQSNAKPVNESNVNKIKNVYISNSAVDIWDFLCKNSVLFEMYVDDIWINNDHRTAQKKRYRGFDTENYNTALKYMHTLIEKEALLRNQANNLGKLDKFFEMFGELTITGHLLNGLQNSLNAFYKEKAAKQSEMKEITNLKNKIDKYLDEKIL